MKRGIALILALLMLAAVLSGCGDKGVSEPPLETPLEATPEPTPDRDLSWARAFHDDSLPEGSLSPEEIAFFLPNEDGEPSVVNVSREEVWDWWNGQETLPRTHYYEQFMPHTLQGLYPVLDYAVAHSYSSFCVPSTDFTPSDVAVAKKCLQWMYRVNGNIISAESCGSFDLGGGKTLQYILVTLRGMSRQGTRSEYQESIARAREIVAGIPEGSGDCDKIFYLYNWLTENVVFGDDEYYNSEWNLLYDTLVKNRTVCAGYAEALYVMSNLAGVECFVVMGNLYDGENWESHAWNVAKIDGEYYQFDSTWDAGIPPERYCFFGLSDETLQSFWPRLVQEPPKEYRQSCTNNLSIPGAAPFPEDLNPGSVEDGVYSQPFADLVLTWDASWTVYSRDEIAEVFYGGTEITPKNCLRMGMPYMDLVLQRDDQTVQVMLELVPVVTADGRSCDSPESYMDTMAEVLPAALEAAGLRNTETKRFEQEIGGQSYACVTVNGSTPNSGFSQTYLCTERNGCFLTISLAGYSEEQCRRNMQELFSENP